MTSWRLAPQVRWDVGGPVCAIAAVVAAKPRARDMRTFLIMVSSCRLERRFIAGRVMRIGSWTFPMIGDRRLDRAAKRDPQSPIRTALSMDSGKSRVSLWVGGSEPPTLADR